MLSPRPTVILVILSDTEILIRNTTQNYYIVFVGNHLCCWFIVCLCRNVLCLQKQIPLSLYVCVCVCVCMYTYTCVPLSFLPSTGSNIGPSIFTYNLEVFLYQYIHLLASSVLIVISLHAFTFMLVSPFCFCKNSVRNIVCLSYSYIVSHILKYIHRIIS